MSRLANLLRSIIWEVGRLWGGDKSVEHGVSDFVSMRPVLLGRLASPIPYGAHLFHRPLIAESEGAFRARNQTAISTVRYLGIEVNDAFEIAEKTEIWVSSSRRRVVATSEVAIGLPINVRYLDLVLPHALGHKQALTTVSFVAGRIQSIASIGLVA